VVGPEGFLFQMARGMANIEESIPIGPDTPFNLASVTKQFTATGIMMLYEEGLLDPTDPVAEHLSEAPASWSDPEMTLHHLLTHQSGIPDFLNDFAGGGMTNEEVLAWAVTSAPEFLAGERYEYSNTGYTLLAIIIERVSGQAFPTFMQERIFEPLAMASSVVPADWPSSFPNEAESYVVANGFAAQYEYPRRAMGEGTNHSSLNDLVQWEMSLRDATLVSPETAALMTTPHVSMGGDCGYGYGWIICNRPGGYANVWHNGITSGYRTRITRAPELHVSVIMLSNGSTDWGPMAEDLLRFTVQEGLGSSAARL
jgi:CubicO group peptidase (beta-lactamase class C family)